MIKEKDTIEPRIVHACAAADRYQCISIRYTTPDMEVSIDLAKCLGGCTCTCHREANGAEIARETWERAHGEEL